MSVTAATSSFLATPESPWLGLRSFTEDAQPFFFGRSDELDDLYERILDKPLAILFGQSGLGKSSLLQAALIPRLRSARFLPIFIRLDHNTSAPALEFQLLDHLRAALGAGGFAALAATLQARLALQHDPADCASLLWLLFHDPQLGFIPPRGQRPDEFPQPIFLIDQFEEIFTLGERPARRNASTAFRETLASLVENRPPNSLRALLEDDDDLAERLDYKARHTRVLLSLREDFLHLLERWRRAMPSLMENRFELRMLSGPQALLAVIRPGELRPDMPPIIPDAVGQAIVRFIAGVGSDVPLDEIDAVPPLLSLVCAELNAQRLVSGEAQITQAQFEGHSTDILSSFYLRSFDLSTYGSALDGVADSGVALATLRRLVEDRLLSADGFRESIAFDTIARDLSQAAAPEAAKAVLDLIVDRRLLTVEERGGVRRMELAHDVLTRIVRASRDERNEKEALEKARLAKEQAEREAAGIRLQRNRLRRWVLVAAACSIIAAAGAVAGAVGAVRARVAAAEARRRQDEARASAAEARRQQADADAGFKAARDTTDKMVARIADKDLAYVPGIQDLREEMARKAVEQYTALLAKRPDDSLLLMGLLNARASQASILEQIGSVKETVDAYESLLGALRQARKTAPSEALDLLTADVDTSYDAFAYHSDLPRNPKLADDALHLCQTMTAGKNRATALYLLARAYNNRGNWELEPTDEIHDFNASRELALQATELDPGNIELTYVLYASTANLAEQYLTLSTEADKQKRLELMAEADRLRQKALDAKPDSPKWKIAGAFDQVMRAKASAKAGDASEAQALFARAMSEYRLTTAANPRVTLYRAYLADGLKEYAAFLSQRQEFSESRKCYQEADDLLETLIGRRDDRPAYGRWLLQILSQSAYFEEGGKGTGQEGVRNPDAAAKIRDKAIKLGRQFLSKYPDAVEVSYQLGTILYSQATNEPVASNEVMACQLLDEAIGGMKAQFTKNPQRIQGYHAESFIQWINQRDDISQQQQKRASAPPDLIHRRTSLLELALSRQSYCKGPDAKQQLLDAGNRLAAIKLAAGRAREAVQLHLGLISFCEAEYKERPYFYYLRDNFGGHFRGLAEAYRALGDKENEVKAWQQWIKVLIVPNYGDDYKKWLDPALIATDANLHGLRTIQEQLPDLKTIDIFCDLYGVKTSVRFYINNAVPGENVDPIADQARWLAEQRDITVPAETRESFRKLANVAHANKYGFADLVNYELTPDPLATAEHRLADARAELTKAEKDSAQIAGKLESSRKATIDALAFAADRALENGKWDKLKEYVEASKTAGSSGPAPASKSAILKFQAGDKDQAFRMFDDSWSDPAFRTAATADFELLSKSAEGKQFITTLSAMAEKQNPSMRDAISGAMLAADKAEHAKALDEAIKTLQQARDTYAKDDSASNRKKLMDALVGAANYGMYAQRWVDVVTWSKESEELDPDVADNYGNEGTALLFQAKYDQALAVYRLHWLDPDGYGILGDSARDDFESLAKLGITHPDTERLKSQITAELPQLVNRQAPSRLDAALKAVQAAEKAFADDHSAEPRNALMYECLKASHAGLMARNWEEAERSARRCLELNPKIGPASLNLATALLFQGEFDKAIEIYRGHRTDSWSGTTFVASALHEFSELEAAGITHPDVARVRKEFATPATNPATNPATRPSTQSAEADPQTHPAHSFSK